MAALQNHIHLSATLTADAELAPDLKWLTIDRAEEPVIFMSLQRSQTGKLFAHRLANADGIVQLSNFFYVIKVQADFGYTLAQRVAQLKAMNGKAVYLCDHFHAADGTDHTPDVRPVVLMVNRFPMVSVGLPFFLVEVQTEDNSL